jgi:hypothetical protein
VEIFYETDARFAVLWHSGLEVTLGLIERFRLRIHHNSLVSTILISAAVRA